MVEIRQGPFARQRSGPRASFREFFGQKSTTRREMTTAQPRMDLSAFVGELLEEQDGDVPREGIRVLSQALMETEVAGLIGGAPRAQRRPVGVSQGHPDADVGHACGHD